MSAATKIEAAHGQSFLHLKNAMQLARWKLKWGLQGGSCLWPARPLKDQRDDESLRLYRVIEIKRRHARRDRRVINLAAWRIDRARRQAAH